MRNKIVVLILIFLLALFLRVWNLDINPPAMHADEADTGYTAFSLLKTGKDPYGNSWPLHFKGQANIYRAPLYTYSVMPFVAFMGLSPVSVRLPSVLFGATMIFLVYILVRKIFNNEKIAFICSTLLAINPWSIHISRTGLEVNLSLFLTFLGITFFIFRDKYYWSMYLSSLVFGLSLFSYHPAKIFSPLIIIFLFAVNFKELKKEKFKYLLYSLIFGFFVALIGYLAIFNKGAQEFNNVSIFDNAKAAEFVNIQRNQTLAPLSISTIFSNKPFYFAREFLNHYVGILSVNYLFLNGESSLDKGIGNYGQYHLFEILPLILGIIFVYKKNKKLFIFLVGWFFIAIVPAGITNTGYYSYRDVNALMPPLIFSSVGIYKGFNFFRKKKLNHVNYLYIAFASFLLLFFVYNYYFSYPVYSRNWWGFSQKEAIEFITKNRESYNSIYIHGGGDWNILYAFYNKVDPKKFQYSISNSKKLKSSTIVKLDNIYFGSILNEDKKIPSYLSKNSLLITPSSYFKDEKPVKSFYTSDNVSIDIKAFEVK